MPEGAAVSLKACPMRLEDPYKTKRQYAARLVEHIARLSAQQQLFAAQPTDLILRRRATQMPVRVQ